MNRTGNPRHPAGAARRLRRAAGALLLALAGATAAAAPLEAGQPWPPLVLADQHDRPWRVEPGTRLVVFAADKAASDLAVATLGADGAARLAARRAVFLADLHAMPALVTRLFALPALRELPYPVGLARDGASAADLPRRRAALTLVELDADGRVAAIGFAADAETLGARLGEEPD